MKLKAFLLAAVVVSILAPPAIGFAEDCTATFSAEQQKTYSTLSPASKQVLATGLKMRDGSQPTCKFRAGLMDMLINFPAEQRDAALKQLVEKMLIKQD